MEALGSSGSTSCSFGVLSPPPKRKEEGRPRRRGHKGHVRLRLAAKLTSLPRKEVIQPHVPVRLPCYDFVPVTSLALDACVACALAQRLQVLPASMT